MDKVYSGTFDRGVDGDTCYIALVLVNDDFQIRLTHTPSCRMAHYNAPELKSPDPTIRTAAVAAKAYLESLLLDKPLTLHYHGHDRYYRALIDVYTPDSLLSISTQMLAKGFGVPMELKKQLAME